MIAKRFGSPSLVEQVEAVAAKTYELSEFLVDVLKIIDVGAYFPHRVTYHPTCHSLRMLRVGDKPLQLLRPWPKPWSWSSCRLIECCGFGGTFAIKNADTSTAMLADKMRHVLDTGAEICTAGDSSCLMHIGGGLSRLRAGKTVHLAQILAATREELVLSARRRTRPEPVEGRVFERRPERLDRIMPPPAPRGVGNLRGEEKFPVAARRAADTQLRRNLGKATTTIRAKRAQVVAELPVGAAARGGRQLKVHTMAYLPDYLAQLESAVTARGGTVHWARDADEANRIVIDLVRAKGADEVVKVKSMATQEIGLNEALEAVGVAALETDLAELIVQLGHDKPSHILVPAIHRNRAEIREIFLREMADVDQALTDEPAALAAAARQHLRRKFLSAKVGISGANFGIAETGTLGVVESGGAAGCVPPFQHLDHDHGNREARPPLAGSRGLSATAAPILHRRAHEPLHLDVDGRDARRRATGVPSDLAR